MVYNYVAIFNESIKQIDRKIVTDWIEGSI